jgi:hypothetical protein
MNPYKKLNQDNMPLPLQKCLIKQSKFIAMIRNKKDDNLSKKVESLMKEKRNLATTASIYLVLGLTGLGFVKFKSLRPHSAGLAICLLFALGMGRIHGSINSMDNVVQNIGEIPYPEIEKERLELTRRCKNRT